MGDWQPDPLPTPPLKEDSPDQKEGSDAESQDLTGMKTRIRGLVSQFLDGIGYSGPATGDDFDGLLRGVHEQARDLGVPQPEGSKSRYFFIVGLHYARFCYPKHPMDLRIYIGIFTWLVALVDDEAGRDPTEWIHFVRRFHAREPQTSALARALDACLRRVDDAWYEPLVANFIVTASLNFVNATALAAAVFASPAWAPTAGAVRWPYFLRDKDGISEVYSFMTFPRALEPDVACYVEAVPDMVLYINFVNDILSFYKEELAGEKGNYMYNRAFAETKDVYEVFEAVVEEILAAYRRILLVLEKKGKEKYCQAWIDHAMGYVAFHRSLERYRLHEIGLGEDYYTD